MPLIGDLTRPENCAELAERRRILRVLNERGGCALCTQRNKAGLVWGRAVCHRDGRTWPKCTQDGKEPAFTMDEDQLKGVMR